MSVESDHEGKINVSIKSSQSEQSEHIIETIYSLQTTSVPNFSHINCRAADHSVRVDMFDGSKPNDGYLLDVAVATFCGIESSSNKNPVMSGSSGGLGRDLGNR